MNKKKKKTWKKQRKNDRTTNFGIQFYLVIIFMCHQIHHFEIMKTNKNNMHISHQFMTISEYRNHTLLPTFVRISLK